MKINAETIIPLGDRVLIELLPVESMLTETLVAPDNHGESTRIGRVLKVGADVKTLEPKDYIMIDNFMGATVHSFELKSQSKVIRLVAENNIIAKLESG